MSFVIVNDNTLDIVKIYMPKDSQESSLKLVASFVDEKAFEEFKEYLTNDLVSNNNPWRSAKQSSHYKKVKRAIVSRSDVETLLKESSVPLTISEIVDQLNNPAWRTNWQNVYMHTRNSDKIIPSGDKSVVQNGKVVNRKVTIFKYRDN